jgi:phage/plasmid-associated DNA primase
VCDDFFGKNADTSRGKLLFSDGIYDFDTNTFTEGFNPSIVFKHRIDRPYPKVRNDEMIATVLKVLFKDTFLVDEMEASHYLRKAIARALYGDYQNKAFYFCVGKSNAGKGVLTDALKSAFGGFVGTFNAGALAYNERNGADVAKQLSWVFGIRDKRMVISNEVSMNKPFDGNMLKMLASGGDEFDARRNHKDEVKLINRSTMFCLVNDIPTINPFDDGVGNRVRCIDYKCVFKTENITQEFERQADITIKDKFKNQAEYQDALVHIVIDSFQEFLANGHQVPEFVQQATKEWTGDAGSVEGLMHKRYEVTRDMTDYVQSRDILNFLLKEEKLTMSEKKIGMELASLKLVRGDKKIKGKTCKVWYGIRELDIGYAIDDEYDN